MTAENSNSDLHQLPTFADPREPYPDPFLVIEQLGKQGYPEIARLLVRPGRVGFVRKFVTAVALMRAPGQDNEAEIVRQLEEIPADLHAEIKRIADKGLDAAEPEVVLSILRSPAALLEAFAQIEESNSPYWIPYKAAATHPKPDASLSHPLLAIAVESGSPESPAVTLPEPRHPLHRQPWRIRPESWLTLALVITPPLLLTLSVYAFGDRGLALPGWAASVQSAVQSTSQGLALLVAAGWFAGYCWGWLKNPNLNGLTASVSLAVAAAAWQAGVSNYQEREMQKYEALVQDHRWVSYDSVFYWPKDLVDQVGHPAQEPTTEQIRQELTVLHRAGFSGLYLHECRTGSTDVPRIAREVGFTAIIQGIRVADPKTLDSEATQEQIRNAMSVASSVDAYCLGELNGREVNLQAVKNELARIRSKTNRPVTTSFLHEDYIGKRGERFRALDDFTIRSFARPWNGNQADPDAAVAALQTALDSFRDDNLPSLLTGVFYPSGGEGPGFSEKKQARFFAQVKKLRIPVGVNIVYFNSFDRPWARRLSEVSKGTPKFEGYTGLMYYRGDDGSGKGEFIEKEAMKVIRGDSQGN